MGESSRGVLLLCCVSATLAAAGGGVGAASDRRPVGTPPDGWPGWQVVFPQHKNRDYWNTRPRCRYSHTATVVGERLLIAFGYYYDHWDGGKATWLRDVWALVQDEGGEHGPALGSLGYKWDRVWLGVGEGGPAARMSQAAIRSPDGQKLVIYGGAGLKHEKLRDLWTLDPQDATWEEIRPTNEPPPGRTQCSAVLLGDALVIYGGMNLGDLWSYDFQSRSWTLLLDTPSEDRLDHPGKRGSHSATVAPGGEEMYVFGGFRHKGDVQDRERFATGELGDLWVYSRSSNSWREIQQANPQGKRQYCSMALLQGWSMQADTQGLVVFGGSQCNPNCTLVSNMQFFGLTSRRWINMTYQREPLNRYKHTMTFFQGHLWLFGGETYKPYMYHNSVERVVYPPMLTSPSDAAEL